MTPAQLWVLEESKRALFNYNEHQFKHRYVWRGPFDECAKCARTSLRVLKAALLCKTIFLKEPN
jgi:hypothetical protein